MVAPSPGRGKAYFVERLLKEVMIGESGLAGINRRLEARRPPPQLGAYVATRPDRGRRCRCALSVSYGRNRDFSRESASQVAELEQRAAGAGDGAARAHRAAPRRHPGVVDSADRYPRRHRLGDALGTLPGRVDRQSARDAYVRELDSLLLPRVARCRPR